MDFESIVDSAISPFAVIDEVGTIMWVSASITELTGWLPGDLVGTNMLEHLDEPSQAAVIDSFSRFVEASADGPDWLGSGILLTIMGKGGAAIPCVASSATEARTGIPGMVIQLARASAQTHLQRAVAAMAAGESLADVLAHVACTVASEIAGAEVEIAWGWDGDSFEGTAGSGVDLLGRDDGADAAGGDGSAGAERPWATALATGGPAGPVPIADLPEPISTAAAAAGITGCWAHAIAVVADEAPSAVVVVWRSREVDLTSFTTQYVARGVDLVAIALQWGRGRHALERQARLDPLTGLANRRALFDHLGGDGPSISPATVLFCDLDRFKPINDDHGHSTGDRVLAVIGERLQASVRPSDMVARYGGDEFAIVCPGLVDDAEVAALVDRLRRALAEPIPLGDGATVVVGASFGTAPLAPTDAPADALNHAANAMAAAKRRSR